MDKMTRSLLLLFLVFSCLLAGCSKETAPEPEALITVGFSQLGSESSWRLANSESMKQALSEENGFELIFDNAMQNQAKQLLAIRNFIQQGVDYIVLAPIAETGWDDVLQEAKDAGIPVIIVDRQVKVSDPDLYVCWVGSDFLQEGLRAVEWLSREKADAASVQILHLQGTEGATAQIQRTAALREAVAQHTGWEITAVFQGEYTEAKAYEQVRDLLAAGGSFDVIYSENDNMTFGAIRAMEEAGWDAAAVTVLSFDAVREALSQCLAGRIDLCVECNPLHGPRVADIIRALEEGKSPEKEQYVDEAWYTAQQLTADFIAERAY